MKAMLFVFGLLPLTYVILTRNFDLMIPVTIITLALVSMAKAKSA